MTQRTLSYTCTQAHIDWCTYVAAEKNHDFDTIQWKKTSLNEDKGLTDATLFPNISNASIFPKSSMYRVSLFCCPKSRI